MKRILIIEDQPDLRALARLTLDTGDYELTDAADAAKGWEAALQVRPHVVLLDIMMPGGLDGLQLCERLKTDPRTKDARVVMVTARGHRNDMETGRLAGADDYLIKPYSPARLLEVVAALGEQSQVAD